MPSETDPIVLANLIRFKHSLTQSHPAAGGKKRIYSALLDSKTGELLFETKRGEGGDLRKHLRNVDLIITEDEDHNARCRIEAKGGVENTALRIAKETAVILSRKMSENRSLKQGLPEAAALEDIHSIHTHLEKNIVKKFPGYEGHIGRSKAESLLKDRTGNNLKRGSYLIRDGDENSAMLVERWEKLYRCSIRDFFIVYTAEDEVICEKWVLHLPWGWVVYNDETDLKSEKYKVYDTFGDLMSDLNKEAKYPRPIEEKK